MKTTILLFLLFSTLVQAEENCDQLTTSELDKLAAHMEEIEWFAVSKINVQTAFCSRRDPFSAEEMTTWLGDHHSDLKTNESIYGINFEDESPEDLKTFKFLTTATKFGNIPDPERQKTFTSSCTKVDCALKEIFGEELALPLKFMHRRYGMNGSHLTQPNLTPWKKENLDHVLLSLSDFPDGIFPIQENRSLTRSLPGMGEGVLANAIITVYDEWEKEDTEGKRSSITHELGHTIGLTTKMDKSEAWIKASGWSKINILHASEATIPDVFVSRYAKTNSTEDFAESVVAYRYNPQHLKKISPEKYEMIKQTVFDEVEYTSQEACEQPVRLSQKLQVAAMNEINKWEPTNEELKTMANTCNPITFSEFTQKGYIDTSSASFQACYEKALRTHLGDVIKKPLFDHPYKDYLDPMLRNIQMDLSKTKIDFISKIQHTHKKDLYKHYMDAFKKFGCYPGSSDYAFIKFEYKAMGMDLLDVYNEKAIVQMELKVCANKKKYLNMKMHDFIK